MAKAKKPVNKKSTSLPRWLKWSLWTILILTGIALIYENKRYIRRAYRYFTHKYTKTQWKPSDFPLEYEIHGIDISHYQDVLDWKKLQAINTLGDTLKMEFVIMKATEGMFKEDDAFADYWDEATANGLVRGAYHYFLPDRSVMLQANNFTTTVKLKKGDLPPVIDIEETRGKSKKEIVKALRDFAKALEKEYKTKPIIYSNINFIEDYLADDFKDYPFWIAHYYQREIAPPDSIRWLFWQHSDKADILGINGPVDANVFNGTRKDFQKLLIK
ncbi:MAG: glycoside hydrolase family 25 protein [Chitinophagales bacterium]|nr:glycoside hydrolase family 25 protein [Chitinophagales bacterium]MDW8420043.1 GH25 family lysozyme [Chitinophagales bacterium]